MSAHITEVLIAYAKTSHDTWSTTYMVYSTKFMSVNGFLTWFMQAVKSLLRLKNLRRLI